jgi:hypothetical protein
MGEPFSADFIVLILFAALLKGIAEMLKTLFDG